jgi:hypothetical protein
VAGCCHEDADCAAPFAIGVVAEHRCRETLCAPCETDADCGVAGNCCLDLPSAGACGADWAPAGVTYPAGFGTDTPDYAGFFVRVELVPGTPAARLLARLQGFGSYSPAPDFLRGVASDPSQRAPVGLRGLRTWIAQREKEATRRGARPGSGGALRCTAGRRLQQLVKNLYLDGRKTLGRKVQELLIAWQMEQTISKDRILELYVNCIEFVPGI